MIDWKMMSRLLESTKGKTPTEQVKLIATELDKFTSSKSVAIQILAREYPSNNIGLAKAKSWLTKIFNCFDDEIETLYAIDGELGEAIYLLDTGAETQRNIGIVSVLRVLENACGSVNDASFLVVQDVLLKMSALERKWFVRYWLSTPRNGVNESTVNKAMTYRYGEKIKPLLTYRKADELIGYAESGTLDKLPKINWFGRFIKPMLAKSFDSNLPDNYIVDTKYDGNRYQIHITEKEIIIFNRSGKTVRCFPDIEAELLRVFSNHTTGQWVFDSEIYPINEDGTPAPHQKMGTRVHSKDIDKAMEECPVKIVFFDALVVNNESIMEMPYSNRLKVTEDVWGDLTASQLPDDIESAYVLAIHRGYEGVMIKDADAPYQTKRTKAMMKYKPPRIEIDATIVSAKYGKGKRHDVLGTFEIAVLDEFGDWISLGSVGSGLSDGDLVRLTNTLKRVVEKFEDDVFYTLPRVVLEVTADAITENTNGTYGLRFPRVLRIRDDKSPRDCSTLEELL